MATSLFYILVFPGFLFLSVFGLLVEYIDRKLYARMQNRKGPPWFQPLADFIKLVAKRDIIPEEASSFMFKAMPVFALTAALSAFFYIPIWSTQALFSFTGDVIVVIYFLTIPTLAFFLGGWYSTSLYSTVGAMRAMTQLFAYEVPMFMAILAPAILAGSWSLSEITAFYAQNPLYAFVNIIGFVVALIALQGKLERVPFDIPEAETEIVGGTFTEYSGRLLAFFRMAIDIEMIVGASLVAAVFLPFGLGLGATVGFVLYIVKVLFIVGLLALLRTVTARLRIEQMVEFCWKWVAPAALLQLLISLILSGVIVK
ncbi:MAG: NADH dehydrogenase [Bdellovibrionales bacterium RIFOXYD1_FULL_44_7]|nr:MAG: NADH dehydrogenase [Bdellovibrionales bacterium RIFOXYD1_FULL_44_7]